MEFLFMQIAVVTPPPAGQGLLVTLAFRVLSVILATVGMVYYLRRRREVDEAYHQAELEEEAGDEGLDETTIGDATSS